jgi:hypothetical protein
MARGLAPRASLSLVVVVALVAGACGDDDEGVAVGSTTETTAADTTASTTTAPPETLDPGPADDSVPDPEAESEALDFFRSTEAECRAHTDRVGNMPPEPQRFAGATVVGSAGDGAWLVEDGLGDELIVDLVDRVVYSTDGPEMPLPTIYSFGCPEDRYLGTHWD